MVSNLTQQDALKDMFRFDPDLVPDEIYSLVLRYSVTIHAKWIIGSLGYRMVHTIVT